MKLKLSVIFALSNLLLFAQSTTESLSMGPGYGNDVYYSLDNGVVKTMGRTDWHIAFTTRIVDAAILINDAAGTNVYKSTSALSDWATFDTTGLDWTPLHNSDLSWSEGAFNMGANGHPDYGWGNYNQTTHNVIGSKIFVIQLPDTTYKKMAVDHMMTSGEFQFRIADLDGTNEDTVIANKGDYNSENFFYYNIDNDSVFSREPAKTTWDLLFTKYYAEILPGTYYPVTGIKQNAGTAASMARGVDTTMVVWSNYPTSDTVINVLGHDWKEFDMGTFSWKVEDSLSYFVSAQSGDLYKIVFKTWSGSSTGNLTFSKTLASSISVEEMNFMELLVYPNPANDFIQIKSDEEASIEIYNMSGVMVKETIINGNGRIELSDLNSGNYVLRATSNDKLYIGKLIIL